MAVLALFFPDEVSMNYREEPEKQRAREQVAACEGADEQRREYLDDSEEHVQLVASDMTTYSDRRAHQDEPQGHQPPHRHRHEVESDRERGDESEDAESHPYGLRPLGLLLHGLSNPEVEHEKYYCKRDPYP